MDFATSITSLPEGSITLFPNPVADRLSIGGLEKGPYEWELLDLSGRRVYGGSFRNDGRVAGFTIDAPAGGYLLRISDGSRTVVEPLVKL
jgi:hypothetical protein